MVLKSARCCGAAWPWLVCAAALAAAAAHAQPPRDRDRDRDGDRDEYAGRKRAELLQETYLPEHQMPGREARAQSKFWSGSRYGRSGWTGHGGGGAAGGGPPSSQPRLEVEPRGDRFFMGSRYGKRAGRYAARSRVTAYDGLALAPFELPPPLAASGGLRPLRPRR